MHHRTHLCTVSFVSTIKRGFSTLNSDRQLTIAKKGRLHASRQSHSAKQILQGKHTSILVKPPTQGGLHTPFPGQLNRLTRRACLLTPPKNSSTWHKWRIKGGHQLIILIRACLPTPSLNCQRTALRDTSRCKKGHQLITTHQPLHACHDKGFMANFFLQGKPNTLTAPTHSVLATPLLCVLTQKEWAKPQRGSHTVQGSILTKGRNDCILCPQESGNHLVLSFQPPLPALLLLLQPLPVYKLSNRQTLLCNLFMMHL